MSKIKLPEISPLRGEENKGLQNLVKELTRALKAAERELQRLEDNKQDA